MEDKENTIKIKKIFSREQGRALLGLSLFILGSTWFTTFSINLIKLINIYLFYGWMIGLVIGAIFCMALGLYYAFKTGEGKTNGKTKI